MVKESRSTHLMFAFPFVLLLAAWILPVQAIETSADVQALVNLGPRVGGSPANQRAGDYLVKAYQQAGYQTQIQTFTYSKFVDSGSTLTVGEELLSGAALVGSAQGEVNAPLVPIAGVGRPEEFSRAKGAIAVVRRGELRFLAKARNAERAGAVALVVVNDRPEALVGATLGEKVGIPVLGLSGKLGQRLLENPQPTARLKLQAEEKTITGRNILAYPAGVTRPKVLLGAHYDAVPGSPGANDNASGSAVLLELARRLQGTPVWFVAFDGEEDGLRGSAHFVKQAGQPFLKDLRGMLNFDMVGVNAQLLVGGSENLVALARQTVPGAKSFKDTGLSDHGSFRRAGVPALFFYRGQEPNYHSPQDRTVDADLLEHTVQAGLAVVKPLIQ